VISDSLSQVLSGYNEPYSYWPIAQWPIDKYDFAFPLVDFCSMNCYSLLAHATKGGEFFTNMTVVSQYEDRRKTARPLYEQYGKPLEAEHPGEYVVISNNGKTIVGKSLTEVVLHAIERFGKGNFVFKIGSRVVGSFR